MINEISQIVKMMLYDFYQLWPYLLLTIPITTAINVSGVSKNISKSLSKNSNSAILLALLIGAFSPFCSCGVIPIVASLLIGGVPLAPIMTFWIASPSMDPEIFFLSAGMLGWDLAVWRLASTIILSLSAGYLTKYLLKKNWFGPNIIVIKQTNGIKNLTSTLIGYFKIFVKKTRNAVANLRPDAYLYHNYNGIADVTLCCTYESRNTLDINEDKGCLECGSSSHSSNIRFTKCSCGKLANSQLLQRILKETGKASLLIFKFMGLAFLIKAVILLFVPSEIVLNYLGSESSFSILASTFIGVPFYVSNLAALPLLSGLLEQGMSFGAALAFLIAGPVTTLPAMAAVWGITNKRVFLLYIFIPIIGAIFFGYVMSVFY